MDYKYKYFKYKSKYQELLNKINQKGKSNINVEYSNELFGSKIQYGGSETKVPSTLPSTYSFLFMPLIYYTIDSSSVKMVEGFADIVNECIANTKEIDVELPFTDCESFFVYLRFALEGNRIHTLEDIEKLRDGDHHIPGDRQEIVTNYNTDIPINTIISCLAAILVERHQGKKFTYNK